jgi:hypothetical protein
VSDNNVGNHSLIDHLKIDLEFRDPTWTDQLYQILPNNSFYYHAFVEGPEGRKYIMLSVMPVGNERIKEFSFYNQLAFKNEAGIAILLDAKVSENPSATISWGCIWSYEKFGDLRGAYQQVVQNCDALSIEPDNPFKALNPDDKDEYSVGEPSEQFLPNEIKIVVAEQIKNILPNSEIKFKLLKEHKYILSMRILVELNNDIVGRERELSQRFSWFFPPYLPVIFSTN